MRWHEILIEMSRGDALAFLRQNGVENPEALDAGGLRRARRTLAKALHPDRHGGDQEPMKRANAAIDALLDDPRPSPRQPPSSPSGGGPSARRESEPYPIWAMAGYSGGMRDNPNIYRQDYSDVMFIKKRMWELSGQSREQWTLWNFDGAFFRQSITVYGSEAIFADMAAAMRRFDFHPPRAVFAQRRDGPLLLIWSDGKDRRPPVPFEHDSFNANPGNDQSFVRRLPAALDALRDSRPAVA